VTVTSSALFLDGHFSLFLGLDGVFLGRALVKHPKVTVDAGIYDEAPHRELRLSSTAGLALAGSRVAQRFSYLLRRCSGGSISDESVTWL